MLIGYARVSKADGSQSLDLQRAALRAAGVVWTLDRLGRTLVHLVNPVWCEKTAEASESPRQRG